MLYQLFFAPVLLFTDIRGATVPELSFKSAKPINPVYSMYMVVSKMIEDKTSDGQLETDSSPSHNDVRL